jgi:translation initiation factor 3 subunit L
MEGWDVYRELFDELLMVAEDDASSTGQPKLFILPDWAFDILHEFVYQFQGFCQFRTALYTSANKHNLLGEGEPNPKAPHHVVENLALMNQDDAKDVWSVETVMQYLHRLIAIGTKSTVPVYQYFGIFASITISRLECLLTDYTSSLQVMAPILESDAVVTKVGEETKTFPEVVHSVFAARLSLTYHAGISFLMLRRYKDAATMVGSLCSHMQRGFKTGQLRKLPNTDQFYKNYDRMIALLAIVTHLCPQDNLVEESIAKVIREKHGAQLSKENYTDLFLYCAPKFVSPIIPDFSKSGLIENAYKHQVHLLEQEFACQSSFRELRSYLKLYTSIGVSKLTAFGNDEKALPSLKLKLRQWESNNGDVPSLKEASLKSALDIHYYLEDDEIVHIDEAEKQRRFENYFMGQSAQSFDIRKDATGIDTTV